MTATCVKLTLAEISSLVHALDRQHLVENQQHSFWHSNFPQQRRNKVRRNARKRLRLHTAVLEEEDEEEGETPRDASSSRCTTMSAYLLMGLVKCV